MATGVFERVLSTLLNELDGVEVSRGVVVIGATGRIDAIDKVPNCTDGRGFPGFFSMAR